MKTEGENSNCKRLVYQLAPRDQTIRTLDLLKDVPKASRVSLLGS